MSASLKEPQFIGIQAKFTDVLKFINNESYKPIPIYRVLSSENFDSSTIPVKVCVFINFYFIVQYCLYLINFIFFLSINHTAG